MISLSWQQLYKIAKELDHPRKGLVNIQKLYDNECF